MSLKDDKQQNIQMELDFSSALTGATRGVAGEETESLMATNGPESPARTDRLMEEVVERENLKEALRQVKGNKGSDKLMGQIAKRVEDKRLLKLIRAFLNAGVMENGLVNPSVEGTPQGGPLSHCWSNLVLDELDRELERRG